MEDYHKYSCAILHHSYQATVDTWGHPKVLVPKVLQRSIIEFHHTQYCHPGLDIKDDIQLVLKTIFNWYQRQYSIGTKHSLVTRYYARRAS